jgi:hypothetical protein
VKASNRYDPPSRSGVRPQALGQCLTLLGGVLDGTRRPRHVTNRLSSHVLGAVEKLCAGSVGNQAEPQSVAPLEAMRLSSETLPSLATEGFFFLPRQEILCCGVGKWGAHDLGSSRLSFVDGRAPDWPETGQTNRGACGRRRSSEEVEYVSNSRNSPR